MWHSALVGSLLLAKLPDHIGGKSALLYSALIIIIRSILKDTAQNPAMFLVARVVFGLGSRATEVAGFLLIAETLPVEY